MATGRLICTRLEQTPATLVEPRIFTAKNDQNLAGHRTMPHGNPSQPTPTPQGIDITRTVTLGGNPFQVDGNFPQKGQTAEPFSLVGKDLTDVALARFSGKRKPPAGTP